MMLYKSYLTKSSIIRAGKQRIQRCFSSTTTETSSTIIASRPIVELREYLLFPEHVTEFAKITEERADVRKGLLPLRLFGYPETGGVLNNATHAYYYPGGMDDREKLRNIAWQNPAWLEYVNEVKHCVFQQKSTIFVEAPLVYSSEEAEDHDNNGNNSSSSILGLKNEDNELILNDNSSDDNHDNIDDAAHAIMELRRYQLVLGYDSVPKFLELYGTGIPSKLTAIGTDPKTRLLTVMYTEVGSLNEVVEIWYHGNGVNGMERSRIAARNISAWRSTIAGIANLAISFTSTIHNLTPFSPIR
mmetsp:Transcript_25691/g.29344  ORF Transcript_25691/g.29344 Transcript_25691/m.29344 type:complete len:302 (-) Transcript_25691:272-1177(-)